MTTACFTGHRPNGLFGYNDRTPYNELRDTIIDISEEFIDNYNVDTFISGGAQGVDQLAFWSINKIKADHNVKNIVYIPSADQSQYWRDTGLFGKDEYKLMLDRADYVRTLAPESIKENQKTGELGTLKKRDIAMVDASDMVIAIWNKNEPILGGESGGTRHCVKYAVSQNKPVFVYDLQQDKLLALSPQKTKENNHDKEIQTNKDQAGI